LNGDLPDVRPSASVTRQVLRIRSQKPKRHAALSRRRNQCRPPIGDVRPHSPLIVEGLSTEISLKTVFIRDARGRMDLALASIPFKLPAPRPDDRLVEPAQSGSSIGAMGGTRKGSSGPASHRNAPGQSTPGAYPCTGTCKRSSTLDPPSTGASIVHRRADAIVEGLSVRLYVQKTRFRPGKPTSALEFRGKTTKDAAVRIDALGAPYSLTTTFDRRQLNAAKWSQENRS